MHGEPPGRGPAAREAGESCACDPKDGELCLGCLKPGETLVEGLSGSDVQIDRGTWV